MSVTVASHASTVATSNPITSSAGIGRSACHARHNHHQVVAATQLTGDGEHAGEPSRAGGADVVPGGSRQPVGALDVVLGSDDRGAAALDHHRHVGDPVVGLVVEDPVGE